MNKLKTIVIVALLVIVAVLIFARIAMPTYSTEYTLIKNYGVLQRTAYEKVIRYCNQTATINDTVCSDLLIQDAVPYIEEYGSGYIFTISNTRNVMPESVVFVINVMKDGTVKSIDTPNVEVLNNLTQVLRP